jgi:hypothetical protein
MKKCPNCNNDIEDDIAVCPYCKYESEITDPRLEMIMAANEKKDENDTEFRIERDLGNLESIAGDVKGSLVLSIICFILAITNAPWACLITLLGITDFASKDFTGFSNLIIGTVLVIITLLLLFGAIKFLLIRNNTKYLMKNGIILKNIKFVAKNKNTNILRVTIDYIAEDGKQYSFKGILPKYLTSNKDICDVLVDPNNYKKYIIRYNIY